MGELGILKVASLACAVSLLGSFALERQQQARSVASCKAVHALVMYDYHRKAFDDFDMSAVPALPEWMIDTVGVDSFCDVVWVEFDSPLVDDAVLASLSAFDRVQVVHISNTSISDAGLQHLAALGDLEFLTLNSYALTDAALAHVGQLKSLRRLQIEYASITDEGLKHLYGLSNLETFELFNTQVTPEGIAALQKAIPNLEVELD